MDNKSHASSRSLVLLALLLCFQSVLLTAKVSSSDKLPEVVCIRPSRTFEHLMTHSWDFLDVDNSEPSGLLRRANHGEDIIIGVIDSGVWPEAKSFNDEGYDPVPMRWIGKCVLGEHFDVNNCNRKLIGVRYYKGPGVTTELQKGDCLSARDSGYHDTHIACIVASNNVSNVNVYQMTGLPVGAARGGAPRARIAVYNVCWVVDMCNESDTIKAIKDAIQDGVDVISISLGSCPRRSLCSCSYETLEGINAKGNVVFCYDPYNSDGLSPTKTLHVAFSIVNDMGAKGLILAQHPFNQIGRLRPEFPYILVDFEIAQRISDYDLRSIRPSVKKKAARYAIGQEVTPRVATFSSRGPSSRQPELLKLNDPKHDLNLPSIALQNLKKKLTVTRTITNVTGDARVVYKAVINSPTGVKMVVQPSTLVFNANAKVKIFNVTFTSIHSIQGIYRFGSLAWDDNVAHYVRIHIAVRFPDWNNKEEVISSIVYSYGFSGFAVKLSKDFLGVDNSQPSGLLCRANHSEDIIIGVIDSGVCQRLRASATRATAQYWHGGKGRSWSHHRATEDDYLSARDSGYHGMHVTSVTTSNNVSNVNVYQMTGLAGNMCRVPLGDIESDDEWDPDDPHRVRLLVKVKAAKYAIDREVAPKVVTFALRGPSASDK
ncbi:hypothetical protein ZIOFF_036050 [Zingiber officinale]|uniref:Uncharacterized protein n=1 Tax=Zingiber officinale TaxID=94328 RepID=A0A8J5L8B9_ZINOF|nr:hypothetical protein ZIOFF_036050 [Zingiber officinale]